MYFLRVIYTTLSCTREWVRSHGVILVDVNSKRKWEDFPFSYGVSGGENLSVFNDTKRRKRGEISVSGRSQGGNGVVNPPMSFSDPYPCCSVYFSFCRYFVRRR